MKNEDKAVLSTWFAYLESLKMKPSFMLPFLKHDPSADIIITGINENLYNSIVLQNPSDNLLLIQELCALQEDLQLPLTIWVTADNYESPLHKIICKYFQSPGPFYGMLLDLHQAESIPYSSDITIEPVITQQQIDIYAEIFSKTFNFPNLLEHAAHWLAHQGKSDNPSVLSYIAKVNGTAAGVCSLMIDKKFNQFRTGGLYNACVLPEFRKRGVGTAMASHRINIAKQLELKYLSIILMSTAMARGYCERLGFKNYATLTPYFVQRH